jgi:hypothetical protein
MGLFELIILSFPLLVAAGLSFLNFIVFFRNYFREEETTLFHVALVFLFGSLLFALLACAPIFSLSLPLEWFLVGHIIVWVIVLEIGNSYFSAFLNRSRAAERYVLPIFGAAIGLSLIGAFNPNFYLLAVPLGIEAGIYLVGVGSLLYIFIMAYNRINLILDQFENEELKLLNLTTRIFRLGAFSIGFTFLTVIGWLLFQDISSISLEISKWQLIDWIVYLNVLMYIIIFLVALLQFSKLNFEKIDIPTILNILDAPQQ